MSKYWALIIVGNNKEKHLRYGQVRNTFNNNISGKLLQSFAISLNHITILETYPLIGAINRAL